MFSKRTFRRNKPMQSTWIENGNQKMEDAFFPLAKTEESERDKIADQVDGITSNGAVEASVKEEDEMKKEAHQLMESKESTQSKEEEEEATQSKKEEVETTQGKEEGEEATESKEEEEPTQGKELSKNEVNSKERAVQPSKPDAKVKELTPDEIKMAIAYNMKRFKNEKRLKTLRDVLGLSAETAAIDKEFVTTVAQWQTDNELKVDGMIGPKTAAVIGYEMLQESKLDKGLKTDARKMLERGIVISLSNNTYNDTATESHKKIKFSVFVPKGLNMKDYCLVNWNKGFFMKGDGTYFQAKDYGALRDVNFASWQVDSVDKDPIYWSEPGLRWDYTKVNKRRFSATDDPGPARSSQVGTYRNLKFKLQVYRVKDVPLTTTGNLGGAESKAIATVFWEYKVRVNAAGKFTH